MNTDIDNSLVGLSQEKMQKVSSFRTTANATLAKTSLPSMTVGQAVKYLYASKFDSKKAEDIFHRYQDYYKEFSLSDLALNKHSLNTEIRSKKLEILGARDNDGAQILLFTVKKHKGGESKTAVQLLFLLLDQISESNGTMTKGVTLLVDLQECPQTVCDMKYVTTIFNILNGGYPLYLNMVYILEAPSWFKMSREPVYQSLSKAGKVKMLSLIDLSSVMSPSSLPTNLKFPFKPSASSGSSANASPSRNKSPPKSNPPVAPPPRVDKPMKKQLSEPTIAQQKEEESEAMSGVNVSKMMQVFQGQASTSPPPPPPHAAKAHPLGRGGKLPQVNGTAHQHSNQKHSKPFGASPAYPLQPPKTSSSSSGGGGVPQYDVVGPSPSNTSPVRNVSPPSKYPPLFPPPSSVPPPSYSAPPPPPPSSSKPSRPVVSHKPVWLKSSKVPDTEEVLAHVSYSAEEVGPLHDDEDSIDGPMSRDDSEISSSSSGMSSSNKQKFSPSVGKRFFANFGAEGLSKVGGAGNKIAQVFKKKGAESDKKQTSAASTDEDFSADSGEGGVASKKVEKSGKSRVPVKIFGNKKEAPDQIDLAVKSDNHASGQTPPMSKSSRSHLTQYDSVSVKPTRPMEKIAAHDTNHAQAPPTQTHPYKVTVIRDKGPLSPPPLKTAPPEYAAIQKPHPSKHAHRSLTPPPSLPPQYSDDALLDDEDERVGVAPLHPKRPDKRNAYENICFTVDEDEGEILSAESTRKDEIIYENFGPDKGNRFMSASELEAYVNEKGIRGLSEEYFKIKNEPVTGKADYFRLPCNSTKNRYKDVICYDSTRVTLNSIPDTEGSDYIHANYCNGYQKPKGIILTQGPLKRTVNDYWRMLWEKEVFVIVMATKCVEMRKLKCAQYWPDGLNTVAQFGDISVSVVNDVVEGAYQFRQFVAYKNGETRHLMHYQFLGWPDYGVPENGSDVIDVLDAARSMQGCFSEYVTDPDRFPLHGPPMVIHCSAGIGRSGTFASLDYCIDELRMTNKVNVQECVRLLRQQRAFSIQTDEQYAFCYKTVLEYALYLKAALKR
ncbi:PREDICTED: uncharacterized protein LOC100636373 isoform X2 [Amphimedon queenslandica]|uniref:Tyrosine-protein phosphatase non-receptor type 9 n=1 Tax=Amphimedon queenslandica TaxID=400682 RepID=A0AAN0J9F3_AMPQE|nr:PREDICTED: uncharacterized protein LOC100636373 isoform X2 [Amphimedon queenslandica]|eukprot:XP_019853323.1 PREDICTED: uncharacterized protein LOC100636373 isoform X2 [Amphimedon queenslandica]